MKQFLYRLRQMIVVAMRGRNGQDALAWLSYVLALVAFLLYTLLRNYLFYILFLVFTIYALFRSFSKNIPKRYQENQKFLQLTAKPRKRLKLLRLQWKDRKTHRYFICGVCGQMIRVPKGKGSIEVRCPKCGATAQKRT